MTYPDVLRPHPVPGGRSSGPIVVSGLASDAHTWNLVFLQLLIEELGPRVVNLGPCVPTDLLVASCQACQPSLVVLSSVNGHGYTDGLRAITALRACPELAATPVVIGGKLGISARHRAEHRAALLAAGCAEVYDDVDDTTRFTDLVRTVAVRA